MWGYPFLCYGATPGDGESDVNGDGDRKYSKLFQPWTLRWRPGPRESQIRNPWFDSSDFFDQDLYYNRTYKIILSNLAMSRT